MGKLMRVAGVVLAAILIVLVAAVFLLDPDDYRDEIAARASTGLGREVQLQGPIELKLFPWLALDLQDVIVGNPPDFGDAPELARIGTATASVRLWPLLRGELEIGTVTLGEANFAVVTNARGRSNLEGLFADEPSPESDAPADLSGVALGRVQLREVGLERLDQQSGERLMVHIESLDLDPFRAGETVPLRLRARLADPDGGAMARLRFDGALRVAGDLTRMELLDWEGQFELPEAGINGRAEGGLDLRLGETPQRLIAERLGVTMTLADQALEFHLREPLELRLDEPPAGDLPAAELIVAGQGLDLAGSFTLSDPPSARLAVSGPRLDLRPLQVAGNGREDPAAGNGEVDFSALIGPSLDFDLDLDELILGEGLVLTEVSSRARLRDGRLELEPVDARLFGGVFAGSVRVDFTTTPPRTRIHPRLSGIQAEQVALLVGDAAPLRGLGDLELDVGFSGFAPADILASLDGTGSFSLDDGALLGVDLRRLIDEQLTVESLANVNQAFGGETPFRRLSGRVQAESGVVSLPDLELDAADFGASGQGQLDFADGRVAYRLDLRLGEALVERLPGRLARATGGVIPLAIAGPLTRPVVSVDLVAIAEGALQRELQQRLFDRMRSGEEDEQQPEREGDGDREASEPQRRERTSETLLRSLRERREREREPPPDDAPEESPEERSEDSPEDPPERRAGISTAA